MSVSEVFNNMRAKQVLRDQFGVVPSQHDDPVLLLIDQVLWPDGNAIRTDSILLDDEDIMTWANLTYSDPEGLKECLMETIEHEDNPVPLEKEHLFDWVVGVVALTLDNMRPQMQSRPGD